MSYGDDSINALRSLKRNIGLILTQVPNLGGGNPLDYDVNYRTDVSDRPAAIVATVGAEQESGSAYVRNCFQDYECFIYPPGRPGDPEFTALEAMAVKSRVQRAIGSGGFEWYAMRMPVFDYTDVLFGEPDPDDENPDWTQWSLPDDAEPYNYLPVSNLRVEARQDPDQDDLFTVILDLRLTWMRLGDGRRFEGAILQNVQTVHEA